MWVGAIGAALLNPNGSGNLVNCFTYVLSLPMTGIPPTKLAHSLSFELLARFPEPASKGPMPYT